MSIFNKIIISLTGARRSKISAHIDTAGTCPFSARYRRSVKRPRVYLQSHAVFDAVFAAVFNICFRLLCKQRTGEALWPIRLWPNHNFLSISGSDIPLVRESWYALDPADREKRFLFADVILFSSQVSQGYSKGFGEFFSEILLFKGVIRRQWRKGNDVTSRGSFTETVINFRLSYKLLTFAKYYMAVLSSCTNQMEI